MRYLLKVFAWILSDQLALVCGLASASWNRQVFCICLTYRRKHIFFPCMKGTAILCYLTSKSHRSECDSVSKVIFDPHIFRKLPQCFYLCTYLFLYLLSQVNNPNLSVICPPASPGDAMTIPITTRMLFNDSSRLALVHFFFFFIQLPFFVIPCWSHHSFPWQFSAAQPYK